VATLTYYFSEDLPGNTYHRAGQLIRGLKQLVADLEVPLSLKDVRVPREDLRKNAEWIVEHRQYAYSLPTINPRIIMLENLMHLLEYILNNNIW